MSVKRADLAARPEKRRDVRACGRLVEQRARAVRARVSVVVGEPGDADEQDQRESERAAGER